MLTSYNFTQAFELSNSPADILLTDITDYAGQGITLSNVKGIFQLVGPGGVFYSNPGFTSDDFTSADIDPTVSVQISKPLPVDVNNAVLTGNYSLYYKIQVTDDAYSFVVTTIDALNKLIGFSGNRMQSLLNATGGTISVTDGMSTNTYTIDPANSFYDPGTGTTYVAVTAAVTNNPGDILSYVSTTIYTVNHLNVQFCFQEPQVKIKGEYDCSTGLITATDTTDYTAILCGTPSSNLTPIVLSRTLTVIYPTAPGQASPVHTDVSTSSNQITISPPDSWTGTYQISVVTNLIYQLPGGSNILVTVEGYSSLNVECDNNLCCAYQCIANIWENYKANLGATGNSIAAEEYRKLGFNVQFLWLLVSQAHNCGDMDNYHKYLAQLIQLVKASNCECCRETTGVPTRIVPMFGSNPNTTPTVITSTCQNGLIVNPIQGGYDICLNWDIINSGIWTQMYLQRLGDHADVSITNPQAYQTLVYEPISKTWMNTNLSLIYLSDVDPSSPVTGYVLTWDNTVHKAKWQPVVVHNLIENDIPITGNGTGNDVTVDTLITWTLDPAVHPLADGDSITIEVQLDNNPLPTGSVLEQVWFGASAIAGFSAVYSGYPTNTKFTIILTRTSDTTYIYELFICIPGFFNQVVSGVMTGTTNFANPIVIKTTGQNSLAGANQAVARYQKITINKK